MTRAASSAAMTFRAIVLPGTARAAADLRATDADAMKTSCMILLCIATLAACSRAED